MSYKTRKLKKFTVEMHEDSYCVNARYKIKGFWTDTLDVLKRKQSPIQKEEAAHISWSSGGREEETDSKEAAANFAAALRHAIKLCEKLDNEVE